MAANGQYSQSELVLAEPALGWPKGYLTSRAARAWWAIKAWFKITLGMDISFNEGYRPLATQIYYWNLYQSGKGNPAARPSTSKHGDAEAWDLNYPFNSWLNDAQRAWLANEARFGISSAQGRADNEAWHKVNIAETTVSGGDATPIPIEEEDTDTMKLISVANGTIAIVGELFGVKYTSTSGGQGFSIGTNTQLYGNKSGFTEDQVTTLVNEANARRAALIAELTSSVVKSLPAGGTGGAGPSAAQIASAVDAALADNFAGLPKLINEDLSKRISN